MLLVFSVYIFGQNKAETAIQALDQNFPQEKIHLQFNKSSYAAGEKIWIKSYIFDAYNTSTVSTNLYVELLDRNKKILNKKMFSILNGEADGAIQLPENIAENIYFVRAYTTWMANFSEGFQSIKPIKIYNPKSSEILTENKNADYSIAAYPESGTFIDGIATKVAVRLQSNGPKTNNWKGYVIEKDHPEKHLADFQSFDQNVGLFSVKPILGKQYQLSVESNGITKTIDLPAVASSGVNLQVVSDAEAIKYSLKTKNIPNTAVFKIIAIIGNRMVYKAKLKNLDEAEVHSIPTEKLINGVLQLTVFDEQEKVVAQRLCFVKPQKLEISKPSLQNTVFNNEARKQNSFSIATTPQNISNYAVFIDDADVKTDTGENILSTFWLTGDFSSKIEQPAQYFSENRNTEALDALLISEKWTRFSWDDIMAGKFPQINYQPEKYISYNIKILSHGKPAQNADVLLLLSEEKRASNLFTMKTDDRGIFTLKNMSFTEPQTIYYQLNGTKDTDTEAVVKSNFNFIPLKGNLPATPYELVKRTAGIISPEESLIIETSNSDLKIKEIEEVKLIGRHKTPTEKLNEELSSPFFSSGDEEVYDFVNNETLKTQSLDVINWLQGRVAGLQMKYDAFGVEAYFRNQKVAIYVDEMKIDTDMLNGINTSNIAMIKVLRDGFLGSSGDGSSGAILIYMRTGNYASKDSGKLSSLKSFSIEGYEEKEVFTYPDYKNSSYHKLTQDNRINLYWNPNLKTPEVEFFNNDKAKKFRIKITGIDKDTGKIVYMDEVLP